MEKSLDYKGRWRNHTVAFRVSDEEAKLQALREKRLAALKAILNAKQYRRIWLYYAERKSVTEIARLEGVTKASVSLSLARAIKKISKKFAAGLKNS